LGEGGGGEGGRNLSFPGKEIKIAETLSFSDCYQQQGDVIQITSE